MECAKRDCTKTAVRGSNYCRDHQPRGVGTKGRRSPVKKASKKK